MLVDTSFHLTKIFWCIINGTDLYAGFFCKWQDVITDSVDSDVKSLKQNFASSAFSVVSIFAILSVK